MVRIPAKLVNGAFKVTVALFSGLDEFIALGNPRPVGGRLAVVASIAHSSGGSQCSA